MGKHLSKRTAWLHVDLSGLEGDVITETLRAHRDALLADGIEAPDHGSDEGRLALYELLAPRPATRGTDSSTSRGGAAELWDHLAHLPHRARQLRARPHLARQQRRTPVMSIPGLWDATAEQVDRVLAVLHGADLHLLVSVPTIATTDEAAWVEARLALWQRHLRPGHVHRVAVHGQDWARVWDRLATLAGLDPTSIPLLGERDDAA